MVANEVRNLAVKSAESVKDTTALIQNSIRQAESGTKIANKTARSLRNVVESTKEDAATGEELSEPIRLAGVLPTAFTAG